MFLRLIFLGFSAFALSGCYLMQAAQGQMSVNANRTAIEKVIADPRTDEKLRTRLQLIAEAREFASSNLGLPNNKSYRSYVDLHRDFVVWNVFATERYSVEPRRWCFPIAGCVVYRGYFKEESAQRYARRTRLSGADAAVGGSAAYSTLGHFDDPVLSSMLRWSDAQIAATLFHELAHQVMYVPNESSFNEAFASVVEEEGAKRWLESRNDMTSLAAWRSARQRATEFSRLLLGTRDRLRVLYAEAKPSRDLYYRKQQVFGRMKFDYWQLKASWNGYSGYDAWFDRALNNADLVSAATYDACKPELEKLLESVSGDLPKFYDAVKRLTMDERGKLCRRQSSD
ncbi:MAG TPA: aminopeptidase [Steroidobacteraceae bacterium]|nr:aminopeptidase [Steroidobacteraceae bacterium]